MTELTDKQKTFLKDCKTLIDNKNKKETFESFYNEIINIIDNKFYDNYGLPKLKQLHKQSIKEKDKQISKLQKDIPNLHNQYLNKIKELQAELQELKIRHHCK